MVLQRPIELAVENERVDVPAPLRVLCQIDAASLREVLYRRFRSRRNAQYLSDPLNERAEAYHLAVVVVPVEEPNEHRVLSPQVYAVAQRARCLLGIGNGSRMCGVRTRPSRTAPQICCAYAKRRVSRGRMVDTGAR